MLLCLCTIVLLVLASLRVNAASVTGVIIANDAARSAAVKVAAVDQIQTTNVGETYERKHSEDSGGV